MAATTLPKTAPAPPAPSAELERLLRRFLREFDDLSGQMERGAISEAAWAKKMGELVSDSHQAAMMSGASTATMPGDLTETLERVVQVQHDFLDNFEDDVKSEGWQAAYNSRVRQYLDAAQISYHYGKMFEDVGKVIPLPAMPSEGTICLSNCGCSWDISVVNAAKGDYDATWKLGKIDNCQTCIERAAQWSPVRVRGGVLQ